MSSSRRAFFSASAKLIEPSPSSSISDKDNKAFFTARLRITDLKPANSTASNWLSSFSSAWAKKGPKVCSSKP